MQPPSIRSAFKTLFGDASAGQDHLRSAARTIAQVGLVSLGFILTTHVLLNGLLSLFGDTPTARGLLLTMTGSVYGALYLIGTGRQRTAPAVWISVGLLVLEFALLSLMLPFLVEQAELLLPQRLLLALVRPGHIGLELAVFIGVMLFALRGWARHVARATDAAKAEAAAEVYERMAMEDGLTGLANRRRFESCMSAWLPQAQAEGKPLSLVMIDVNRFKYINDTFSHNVGDQVLRAIGKLLQENARRQDLPVRLAGDEFVVVLRDTPAELASTISQRFVAAVSDFNWHDVAAGLSVSISAGCAVAGQTDSLVDLLRQSDSQMYSDKKLSRSAPASPAFG